MDYRGHKGVCEECGKEVVESHHWISHVFDDDEGKDLSVVEICSMCGVKR